MKKEIQIYNEIKYIVQNRDVSSYAIVLNYISQIPNNYTIYVLVLTIYVYLCDLEYKYVTYLEKNILLNKNEFFHQNHQDVIKSIEKDEKTLLCFLDNYFS